MKWWEKELLRIFEVTTCFDAGKMDQIQEVKIVQHMNANSQHMHCMEMRGGMDEDGLYFKSPLAKKVHPDYLKKYLPQAHKRGIKVIIYFNVHWYTKEFAAEHPDWVQIKEDNKPIDDVYTTGTSFCVNSPWREWVFQILKDLAKYEIDGIFFDGPIFFTNTCYCESCKKLFREKYGEDLPLKSNRNNPSWKKLLEFQSDSIARILKDSDRVIKNINPDILLYMNGNANWPFWPTGRDNRKIIKHTDILGAEGGFLYGNLTQPIQKPGITAKLLKTQAQGKPVVVFNDAGHKPWSWYLLSEPEIRLLLAESIANGANIWIGISPSDAGKPEPEVIREYNSFIKRNPHPYFQTESLARIALLWPMQSANFYTGSTVPLTDFTRQVKAEGVGNVEEEFNGFYDTLVRGHFPFDVIDEPALGDLKKYDFLILPNAACLSEENTEYIRNFVKDGGNLISSFETSLYNEYGERLEDFRLNDVMGLNFSGEIFGPMHWDYVCPVKKHKFLQGITKDFLPSPTYGIKVNTSGAASILSFCERLKGRYDNVPQPSDVPFCTVNSYGKGISVYFAGLFGGTIANLHFKEYYRIIKNIAGALSKSLVVIHNAPSSIEIVLNGKGDRLYLHLINFTSEMKRPIEKIIPCRKLEVTVKGLRKAKRIRALKTGKILKYRSAGNDLSFIVPVINDYEVIEIQKQDVLL